LPASAPAFTANDDRVVEYVMGSLGDAATVARELFRALRLADELKVAFVVVEGVREEAEGLAVMNRLRKAASQIVHI
jgi:L-threonylcarbamoyladenylate synthase